VLAACAASYIVARGAVKPFSPDAPDFRRLGPSDAKVHIVEFSDFQCPACRMAEPPLRNILAAYEGKVRLTFKHFPLERPHPWARPAAVAADCAGRQGRFWEYHHRLYDAQHEWPGDAAETHFTRYAKDLKLDLSAWQACRQDPASDAAVAADIKDGDNAFVGATPTFFVNGKRFVGGQMLAERGVRHLEKELKK
jgi:protein-disulfide isomerase